MFNIILLILILGLHVCAEAGRLQQPRSNAFDVCNTCFPAVSSFSPKEKQLSPARKEGRTGHASDANVQCHLESLVILSRTVLVLFCSNFGSCGAGQHMF